MSSELVKRHVEALRLTGGDLGDLCQPLADAIEALIADRDHAWAMVAKADTQMGQSLADYLQAKVDNTRLREALEVCVASIEHADMSDGVCCCGEEIEGHSDPMHSGHTPVDMGEYHASLAIKEARAALKGDSHE